MVSHSEIPTLANTRTEHLTDLLAAEVELHGQFPVILPVFHILTATIAKGDMVQQGSGRFTEFLATAPLSQPGIDSRVELIRDPSRDKIWAPSCLELAGPNLSRLAIDLFEEDGLPKLQIVNGPEGSVSDEINRFLKLASNRVNR